MVVVDSGPLIALAGVGKLDLLKSLYGRVVIPLAVFAEVCGTDRLRPGGMEVAGTSWLEIESCRQPPDIRLTKFLGRGESEAIALASQLAADEVLLDDLKARKIAESLNLRFRGTAGLLVKAKQHGLVDAVRATFNTMRANGYYLSDLVVAQACAAAGE